MNESDLFKTHERTLEKFKIGLGADLTEYLNAPDVEFALDHLKRHILLQVKGFIWSREREHKEIKYPADWWQALKERWYPQWALDRWPVKYRVHILDVHELYPYLKTDNFHDTILRLEHTEFDWSAK